MRHYLTHIFFLLLFALQLPVALAAEKAQFVVTLDAGHGGTDYGAVGKKTNEKTITLDVTKRLGALIAERCPEVKVVYTRSTDTFIPLADRASIANRAASDLFISIHVNSVDRRNRNRANIEGCQVYTLGLHKTAENLAVAKRENSVMELEADHTERYAGFDANSLESDIVFELSQSHRMDQSIELADAVHSELVHTAHRAPKGVRQAGFWVLWATSMPSILVELDFICNPTAEDYLKSDSGRQELAEAVYNAFASYYNTYAERTLGHAVTPAPRIAAAPMAATEEATQPVPATVDIPEPQPFPVSSTSESVWKIQILASASPLKANSKELRSLTDVEYYKEGTFYKYTTGSFSSLKAAKKELKKVRRQFPEAFIVEMVDGQRVGFTK